jgi:mannose-6-phosphate isomerase-like protein (cupin superfamily)
MNLVETYKIEEEGYHPFLIREGWQVAQLNYKDELHIKNIKKIDVHFQTDEVFVLLKGKAALILAEMQDDQPIFEVELMKSRVVYNIPKNTWHNIAMEEGSEVLIVEKSNTHLGDFEYKILSEHDIAEMRKKVEQVLKD